MFGMNLSSNSDSDDQNFDGQYKKVNYQGNFSDSDHQESQMDDSVSEQSKQVINPQNKNTHNRSSDPLQKSKIIKKNCESAKMSRQRKKVYLELLEQKAQELKSQIFNRKISIKNISSKILQKFRRSNKQKYQFLLKKIALSKQLLTMSQEIEQLRKNSEEKDPEINVTNQNVRLQIEKNLSPDTLLSVNGGINLNNQGKGKSKKKKIQDQKNLPKLENNQKINQKQGYLELGINAFLVNFSISKYQFGVRGSLRTDVIERTKNQWFQNLQKSLSLPQQEIAYQMQKMKNLLDKLDEKNKKLDYYLRELKKRVKQKFVVQFLLDREFFIHNNAETIYKNSQIAPAQRS